jgi:hypothetical protein
LAIFHRSAGTGSQARAPLGGRCQPITEATLTDTEGIMSSGLLILVTKLGITTRAEFAA